MFKSQLGSPPLTIKKNSKLTPFLSAHQNGISLKVGAVVKDITRSNHWKMKRVKANIQSL